MSRSTLRLALPWLISQTVLAQTVPPDAPTSPPVPPAIPPYPTLPPLWPISSSASAALSLDGDDDESGSGGFDGDGAAAGWQWWVYVILLSSITSASFAVYAALFLCALNSRRKADNTADDPGGGGGAAAAAPADAVDGGDASSSTELTELESLRRRVAQLEEGALGMGTGTAPAAVGWMMPPGVDGGDRQSDESLLLAPSPGVPRDPTEAAALEAQAAAERYMTILSGEHTSPTLAAAMQRLPALDAASAPDLLREATERVRMAALNMARLSDLASIEAELSGADASLAAAGVVERGASAAAVGAQDEVSDEARAGEADGSGGGASVEGEQATGFALCDAVAASPPIAVASPPTDAEPPSQCNSSPPWWVETQGSACTKRQAVSPMVQNRLLHQLTCDIDDGDLDGARAARKGRPAGPAGPAGGTARTKPHPGATSPFDPSRSRPTAVASAGGSRPPQLPPSATSRAPLPARSPPASLRSAASCSGPPRPPQPAQRSPPLTLRDGGRSPSTGSGGAASALSAACRPSRGRGGHFSASLRGRGRGSQPRSPLGGAPRPVPNGRVGAGPRTSPPSSVGSRPSPASGGSAGRVRQQPPPQPRSPPGRHRTAPPPLLLDETVEDDLGSDEGSFSRRND